MVSSILISILYYFSCKNKNRWLSTVCRFLFKTNTRLHFVFNLRYQFPSDFGQMDSSQETVETILYPMNISLYHSSPGMLIRTLTRSFVPFATYQGHSGLIGVQYSLHPIFNKDSEPPFSYEHPYCSFQRLFSFYADSDQAKVCRKTSTIQIMNVMFTEENRGDSERNIGIEIKLCF